MTDENILKIAVKAIDSKLGENIKVIKIDELYYRQRKQQHTGKSHSRRGGIQAFRGGA